jgi:multidrug transporter EmrE-like cation transporter
MGLLTLFAGAGFFVTIGDLILAQWARTNQWMLLVIGLLLNVIGIAFYANTLRLESVGVATAIFLGINIIAVTLAGYFFLNQNLSFRESAGLMLMAVALVMIEI